MVKFKLIFCLIFVLHIKQSTCYDYEKKLPGPPLPKHFKIPADLAKKNMTQATFNAKMSKVMKEIAMYQHKLNDHELIHQKLLKKQRQKFMRNIPAKCREIKCTLEEKPVCAKFFDKDGKRKPFYRTLVNKCEMRFMKCKEGLEAKVVADSNCHSVLDDLYKLDLHKAQHTTPASLRNRRVKRDITDTNESENEINHIGVTEKNIVILDQNVTNGFTEINDNNITNLNEYETLTINSEINSISETNNNVVSVNETETITTDENPTSEIELFTTSSVTSLPTVSLATTLVHTNILRRGEDIDPVNFKNVRNEKKRGTKGLKQGENKTLITNKKRPRNFKTIRTPKKKLYKSAREILETNDEVPETLNNKKKMYEPGSEMKGRNNKSPDALKTETKLYESSGQVLEKDTNYSLNVETPKMKLYKSASEAAVKETINRINVVKPKKKLYKSASEIQEINDEIAVESGTTTQDLVLKTNDDNTTSKVLYTNANNNQNKTNDPNLHINEEHSEGSKNSAPKSRQNKKPISRTANETSDKQSTELKWSFDFFGDLLKKILKGKKKEEVENILRQGEQYFKKNSDENNKMFLDKLIGNENVLKNEQKDNKKANGNQNLDDNNNNYGADQYMELSISLSDSEILLYRSNESHSYDKDFTTTRRPNYQDDPETNYPGGEDTDGDDPGEEYPDGDNPGEEYPDGDDPVVDDPGTDDPGTDNPDFEEPGDDNPGEDDAIEGEISIDDEDLDLNDNNGPDLDQNDSGGTIDDGGDNIEGTIEIDDDDFNEPESNNGGGSDFGNDEDQNLAYEDQNPPVEGLAYDPNNPLVLEPAAADPNAQLHDPDYDFVPGDNKIIGLTREETDGSLGLSGQDNSNGDDISQPIPDNSDNQSKIKSDSSSEVTPGDNNSEPPVLQDVKADSGADEVDTRQMNSDCPTACPGRHSMVCAKCNHGIYRTFLSVCHMRMFACRGAHEGEQLQLISHHPCVMSAPILTDDPNMQPKGHVSFPGDRDRVLIYVRCREKGMIGKSDKCNFEDDKKNALRANPETNITDTGLKEY